jgi:hypothetical protein
MTKWATESCINLKPQEIPMSIYDESDSFYNAKPTHFPSYVIIMFLQQSLRQRIIAKKVQDFAIGKNLLLEFQLAKELMLECAAYRIHNSHVILESYNNTEDIKALDEAERHIHG